MSTFFSSYSQDDPLAARCAACESILIHAGAICHVCDTETHFQAPVRTAPILSLPTRREASEPRLADWARTESRRKVGDQLD
jgi:hypothetical protein